jgi:branched-chain amino acid aminotransferase
MQWICYNGSFLPKEQPVFTTENQGFRYGDGVFETMKVKDGLVSLADYHFDRLFSGLKALQIIVPDDLTLHKLLSYIAALCLKNDCERAARVRLAVFRETGNQAAFTLDAYSIENPDWTWDNKGWRICTHPFVQKSCDAFANLKSANFLPYLMAARYAVEQNVDECLVLNAQNNVCDGSRTNLFLIKGNAVYTPALHQGCVSGVMRRYLIGLLKSSGYQVHQQAITITDLLEAEEAFCTNALIGLRFISEYPGKKFTSVQARNIFDLFLKNDPFQVA